MLKINRTIFFRLSFSILMGIAALMVVLQISTSPLPTPYHPEQDKLDRLVTPELCPKIATGNHAALPEKFNEAIRTALYRCMASEYLNSQFTKAEILTSPNSAERNNLGAALEEKSIWYYVEQLDDRHTVGLNLLNTTSKQISWVTVGFAPESCSAKNDWSFILKLPLPQPVAEHEQTILQWDMPEGATISEGCLGILAAGS